MLASQVGRVRQFKFPNDFSSSVRLAFLAIAMKRQRATVPDLRQLPMPIKESSAA